MRFLDKMKRMISKPMQNVNEPVNEEQEPPTLKYEYIPNNRLQVDFYDRNAPFKQFYDTTRLIVSLRPWIMANQAVYDSLVSWYGFNDCEIVNPKTGKWERLAPNDEAVLIQIDLNLLQTDANYCQKVMKDLLAKKRVDRYLEEGLQERPEKPCGNYVGGVRKKENGYGLFFSHSVGQESHCSGLMMSKRQKYQEMKENKRQEEISKRKRQIEKMQSEINELER